MLQNDLKAVTTAAVSDLFTEDRVWLNGIEVNTKANARIIACLTQVSFALKIYVLTSNPQSSKN